MTSKIQSRVLGSRTFFHVSVQGALFKSFAFGVYFQGIRCDKHASSNRNVFSGCRASCDVRARNRGPESWGGFCERQRSTQSGVHSTTEDQDRTIVHRVLPVPTGCRMSGQYVRNLQHGLLFTGVSGPNGAGQCGQKRIFFYYHALDGE